MTKGEIAVLRGLRARLSWDRAVFDLQDKKRDAEIKAATRLYIDTWLIPAIDILLGEGDEKKRDVELARRLVHG